MTTPRHTAPGRPTAVPAPAGPDAAARVDRLARLLDRAVGIPGTGIRFGLDSILGLIPGVGDVATGAISIYIILEAARMGVPRPTLLRMLGNVAVDTVGGSVPLVGDIFDVAWKSNSRNVELLQSHLGRPAASRKASRATLVLVVLGVIALVAAGVLLTVWLVRALGGLLDR